MAKTSSVYRNLKRVKMAQKFNNRRQKLKDIVMDKNASPEERFQATLKLAELPRNSAKNRIRNRCKLCFGTTSPAPRPCTSPAYRRRRPRRTRK